MKAIVSKNIVKDLLMVDRVGSVYCFYTKLSPCSMSSTRRNNNIAFEPNKA